LFEKITDGEFAGELLADLLCVVGGVVVHNKQFPRDACRYDKVTASLESAPQALAAIIRADDDGEVHRVADY